MPAALRRGLTALLTWPVAHPLLALLLAAAVTALLGAQLPRLERDIRHEKGFPQTDPRIADYQDFKAAFGADDETAFVVLDMGRRVLEPAAIARVHALTEALRDLERVNGRATTSLSRAVLVRLEGEDTLEISPLFEPKRAPGWDPAAISALLQRHPVFRDRLISEDEQLAAFLVELHASSRSEAGRRAFAAELEAFFEARLEPGERVWFEGFAVTKYKVLALLADDSARFFPLSLLALLASLGLIFRRLGPVLLASLTVVLSAAWTLGGMAALGIPMSYISTAIPAMILVVCVGDAVYLLSRVDALRLDGAEPAEAVRAAVEAIGGACLFTSVTTAAGFASLGFNAIPIIREMGIPVALGVVIAYLVTFLVLPPLLLLLPAASPRRLTGGVQLLRPRLGRLATFTAQRPRRILLAALLVFAAALSAAGLIKVESRLLEDLDEDEPLMETRAFFEARMGGACPLELLIDGPPGRVLEPDVQQGLARLLEELRGERFERLGLLSALGLTDYLIDAHYTLNDRREASRRLPETEGAIRELLLLYEMARRDPTTEVIDFERKTLRVKLRIANHATGPFFALCDEVEAAARRHLPGDVRVRLTGFTLMTQAAHQSLVAGLLGSFALAFGQVMLLILLFFRSWRLALLSVLPNLLPLVCVAAVMGLAGIPLKLGTSLVFTIVFGIAVDDTVHFIAALHAKGEAGSEAIAETLRGTGTAMILTSLVLVLGYSVLAASHFRANREFGLLVSLTMGFALLADLVLLPALLHLWGRPRSSP